MTTRPYDDGLGELDGRLDVLRRRIDDQGLRAQELRRRHRELSAAADERREAVLDRISACRAELDRRAAAGPTALRWPRRPGRGRRP